jgi:hypothetical protein
VRNRRQRGITAILASFTLVVFVLSAPAALGDAYERGGIYLFSRAFLDDIPRRLAGPGKFRFILQPLVAVILGVRSGLADAKAGLPPYLSGVLFDSALRGVLVRSAFGTVINLLLMGILLDAISQRIILGVSHPGAALVVGPVLIMLPYALARAVSNRWARSTS